MGSASSALLFDPPVVPKARLLPRLSVVFRLVRTQGPISLLHQRNSSNPYQNAILVAIHLNEGPKWPLPHLAWLLP